VSDIKPSSGTSLTQSQTPTKASSLETDALSADLQNASTTKTVPDQGFSPASSFREGDNVGTDFDDDAGLTADGGFASDYDDVHAVDYHDNGDGDYPDLSIVVS
jgi:hypothetical protein